VMAANGNWQQDANGHGNCCFTFYPLVLVFGWQQGAGGGGRNQRVKKSGPDRSSQSTSYASYFPYSTPIMEAMQRQVNLWNIVIIFTDAIYEDVEEHALTLVRT
jgi:hypothetical protein